MSKFLFFIVFVLYSIMEASSNKHFKETEILDANNIVFSIGHINGESHEYVYFGDEKVSELIWRLENVPMLGISYNTKLPYEITFDIEGWLKIDSSSSYLENFDWDSSFHPTEWAFYSKTNTKLTDGEIFNASLSIPIYKAENYKFSALVGFKYDHWRWEDYGGYYIYSKGSFRDTKGTFDNAIGITYEQWLYAPYLGLKMDLKIGEWKINNSIAGTKWAWADAQDHHLKRSLVFDDSVQNMSYIIIESDINYPISKNFYIGFNVGYEHFFKTRGDTVTGGNTYSNEAGIQHESWIYSLNLKYIF